MPQNLGDIPRRLDDIDQSPRQNFGDIMQRLAELESGNRWQPQIGALREEIEDMTQNNKQLAQSRPAGTTAASIYSPAEGESTRIRELIVCNTTATAAAYRIFHDEDGTSYGQQTSLFYDVSLAANSTDIIELNTGMENSSGNFAVRTDTGSALTFTISGEVTPK
jgi:hypothetical protein